MIDREGTIGANRSGIKVTLSTAYTPIVGNGMDIGRWIFPRNWGAGANLDKFGGIIRGESVKGNPKCRSRR